jgi:hypothetical protein
VVAAALWDLEPRLLLLEGLKTEDDTVALPVKIAPGAMDRR